MTRYNITAERLNGTQFTDTIYAADEKAARRDFNEIYRHADKPKIVSIVALGDGYQASKAQEREALEEIKRIISTLGNDSYIATAFKGCIEDAAENIENDWACSMYDRWQTAEAKISDLEAELRKESDHVSAAKYAVTAANDLADAYKTALDEAIAKSLTPDEIETLQHIVFEKRINNDSENSAAAKAIEDVLEELSRRVADPDGYVKRYPTNWERLKELNHDAAGHETHYRDSYGFEYWREYDAAGNVTHYRNSYGFEYWYIKGRRVTREKWEKHYGKDN